MSDEEALARAIKRLRKTKGDYEQQLLARARSDGRRWAMERANYRKLMRVVHLDQTDVQSLFYALDPDDLGEARLELPSDLYDEVGDQWSQGFVEGVREFWDQVKDKL